MQATPCPTLVNRRNQRGSNHQAAREVPILRRRLALLVAVGLALSACTAATKPVDTAPATGQQNPTATLAQGGTQPTAAVTVQPTQAADADAKVGVTRTLFKSWDDGIGYIHYQVVFEVKNTGGKNADIHSGDQSFTIFAADGTVLETGTVNYMFPQVLKPGEFGYYIGGSMFDKGTKLADVGKIEPSLSYKATDKEQAAWDISNLKVAKDSFLGGIQVSGVAKNTGTEDATMGVVGVVLFDANGEMLGGVVDNVTCMDLRAGASKGFKSSYPGTPVIDPAKVKSTKAYGQSYFFF
jgi:hypothetical protein